MKYIYYIIAIMGVFTGLAVVGLFDTRLEISEPLISINDRIISEAEFDRILPGKPSYMTREQFIESLIDKQLLIQEAIRSDINREENFRLSVENFYEQSLIKILLDRKLDSLVVDVTDDEMEKYETFLQNKIFLTKLIYPSMKDALAKNNETIEKIEADFVDLSDDLKYIVLHLKIGQASKPRRSDFGVFIYTLDEIQKREKSGEAEVLDVKRVSLYIQDKKKEQLLDDWIDKIRESAEIWRKE